MELFEIISLVAIVWVCAQAAYVLGYMKGREVAYAIADKPLNLKVDQALVSAINRTITADGMAARLEDNDLVALPKGRDWQWPVKPGEKA